MDEGQTCGLASFLECSICLHLFVDPKLLRCAHHFCRLCVTGIAKKRDDGTTVIKCPMRCKEETVLEKGQTIDSMTASYELKGILEKMQQKNKETEYEASKIKANIRASMELMERKEHFKQATRENIALMERKFENILKKRKASCIAQYSAFLDKQEELLKYKLKTLSDVHLEQYDGVSVDIHQKLLNKSDTDLLNAQENISMIGNQKNEKHLKIYSLSLSDNEFRSTYPLGDLELVDTDDKVSVMEDVVSATLNDTFNINETDMIEVSNKDNKHGGFFERSSKEKKRKRDDDLLQNPLCKEFDITQWVGSNTLSPSPGGHSSSSKKAFLDDKLSRSYDVGVEVEEKSNLKQSSQLEPFDITQLI